MSFALKGHTLLDMQKTAASLTTTVHRPENKKQQFHTIVPMVREISQSITGIPTLIKE